jgi:hypothetical protein
MDSLASDLSPKPTKPTRQKNYSPEDILSEFALIDQVVYESFQVELQQPARTLLSSIFLTHQENLHVPTIFRFLIRAVSANSSAK